MYSNIQTGEEEEEKRAKLFRFPQGTIKKLVKLDEDVHMASQVQINLKRVMVKNGREFRLTPN